MVVLALIAVAFVASFWSTARLMHGWIMNKQQKAGLFAFLLFLWLLPLVYHKIGFESAFVYSFPYHFSGFLFVWAYLFFALIMVQDFAWSIKWCIQYFKGRLKRFPWQKKERVKRANFLCLFCSFILALTALYAGLKTPEIREVKIYTSKLDSNFTFVALSDLHLHHRLSLEKVQDIVNKINDFHPDAIFFLGDFADETTSNLHQHLFALAGLKAPLGKYAVSGNHEFNLGHEEAKEAFKEAEFTYLFNEGIQLTQKIYIAGIPDYRSVRKISDAADVLRALSSAENDNYRILLSHRPLIIDSLVPRQIDLQLSGHTHGGQIFPNHFIMKLIDKYLSGLYQTPNGKLYVSRGAGQWGAQMRLFAPSEITVIRLIAEAHEKLPSADVSIQVSKTPVSDMVVEAMPENEVAIRSHAAAKKKSSLLPIAGSVLQKSVSAVAVSSKTGKEPHAQRKEKVEKNETPARPFVSATDKKETLSDSNKEQNKILTARKTNVGENTDPFENVSKDIDVLMTSMQPAKPEKENTSGNQAKRILSGAVSEANLKNDVKNMAAESNLKEILTQIKEETGEKIENQPQKAIRNDQKEKADALNISVENADIQTENMIKPHLKRGVNTVLSDEADHWEEENELPIYKEELYVEVLRKGGQISSVRVYNSNHDLIADTLLREGTSVLTHTLHNTDGSVETHETIMHVRAMPDRHITKGTTRVFEKKKPVLQPLQPISESVQPAFSPTEDALPLSLDNR